MLYLFQNKHGTKNKDNEYPGRLQTRNGSNFNPI